MIEKHVQLRLKTLFKVWLNDFVDYNLKRIFYRTYITITITLYFFYYIKVFFFTFLPVRSYLNFFGATDSSKFTLYSYWSKLFSFFLYIFYIVLKFEVIHTNHRFKYEIMAKIIIIIKDILVMIFFLPKKKYLSSHTRPFCA